MQVDVRFTAVPRITNATKKLARDDPFSHRHRTAAQMTYEQILARSYLHHDVITEPSQTPPEAVCPWSVTKRS